MNEYEIERALFVSKLSLERCNVYLAHLSALLHQVDEDGKDALGMDALQLISGLEKELMQSTRSLASIC